MSFSSKEDGDTQEGSGHYSWENGHPVEIPKSELPFRREIEELKKSNQIQKDEMAKARRLSRALLLGSILVSTWLTIHPVHANMPGLAKMVLTIAGVLFLPPLCFFRASEHRDFFTWLGIEGMPIYMITAVAVYFAAFA
jgi:hypothetical protein